MFVHSLVKDLLLTLFDISYAAAWFKNGRNLHFHILYGRAIKIVGVHVLFIPSELYLTVTSVALK